MYFMRNHLGGSLKYYQAAARWYSRSIEFQKKKPQLLIAKLFLSLSLNIRMQNFSISVQIVNIDYEANTTANNVTLCNNAAFTRKVFQFTFINNQHFHEKWCSRCGCRSTFAKFYFTFFSLLFISILLLLFTHFNSNGFSFSDVHCLGTYSHYVYNNMRFSCSSVHLFTIHIFNINSTYSNIFPKCT